MGVRANYHFLEQIESGTDWDAYGGVTLGYNLVFASWDDSNITANTPSTSKVVFGIQVGARYCIDSSWAVFGEVGYGSSVLTMGATYSF
ncbi:MAG: hypothetical protein R3Y37_10285 [Rikenellaceae bacterium]